MPPPSSTSAGGRETRLLVTTLVAALAMLLLLARFRFPSEPTSYVEPAAAPPLQRLAAQATYDELAQIMADLQARITPTVEVLPMESGGQVLYTVAPRVARDRLIAVLPEGSDFGALPSGMSVVAKDPGHQVGVVSAVPRTEYVVSGVDINGAQGPRYIAVVEGTALGPVTRPLYVGRLDLIPSPGWSDPLLSVAATQQSVSSGAALYSFDGGFLGLVSNNAGARAVIPSAVLRRLATAARADTLARATLGVEVQPLTPALAHASGATTGAMVTRVDRGIAGEGTVLTGDVIVAIDDAPVGSAPAFERLAQMRTPGASVALSLIRMGNPITVSIVAADSALAAPPSTDAGAIFRTVTGVGAEVVAVDHAGAASRSGLLRGDLVTALSGRTAPDGATIERAFRSAAPGSALLLTVARGRSAVVLALEKP